MVRLHLALVSLIWILDGCAPEVIPSKVSQGQFVSTSGGQPHIDISTSGIVRISWTQYHPDTSYSLRMSTLDNGRWSTVREIARGDDWFVNWADFPSIQSFGDTDDHLIAHWLQMSADGTYDYDIMLSTSDDGGLTWSEPFILHDDGISAEHGFVSMTPFQDKIYASWLDGRHAQSHDHSVTHSHHSAMTLRGAMITKEGTISMRTELDDRVCDCCQTSSTAGDDEIITAYRNRSSHEIRDISYVIWTDSMWSDPMNVYNDGWHIAGCPVNGPAIDMKGRMVAIAWYTEASEAKSGKVQLAISTDHGLNFSSPIVIDNGNPLGRVDLEIYNQDKVVISWIENTEAQAWIKAKVFDQSLHQLAEIDIAPTTHKRASGFPRFGIKDTLMIMAYTQIKGDSSFIQSQFIDLTAL